jgi:hypothetical protein
LAHRPGFPQSIFHYDCELVDSVNQLHTEVFESPKYEGWPTYDEATPTKRSPFGIIPLHEDCGRQQGKPCQLLSPQLRFLAEMMGSDLPYTPIAKREERIQFKQLLEGWLKDGGHISMETFIELCVLWNTEYVQLPKEKGESIAIFPKYVWHLVSHYKQWRINNKKKAAFDEAKESPMIHSLSRNQGIRVTDAPFKRQALLTTTAHALPTAAAAAPPIIALAPPIPPTVALPNTPTVAPPIVPTVAPPIAAVAPPIVAVAPPIAAAPSPPPPPPQQLLPPPPHQPLYYYSAPPPRLYAPVKERKRKRKVCQFCFNGVCNRPFNKSRRCNT